MYIKRKNVLSKNQKMLLKTVVFAHVIAHKLQMVNSSRLYEVTYHNTC